MQFPPYLTLPSALSFCTLLCFACSSLGMSLLIPHSFGSSFCFQASSLSAIVLHREASFEPSILFHVRCSMYVNDYLGTMISLISHTQALVASSKTWNADWLSDRKNRIVYSVSWRYLRQAEQFCDARREPSQNDAYPWLLKLFAETLPYIAATKFQKLGREDWNSARDLREQGKAVLQWCFQLTLVRVFR